ncbi:MULTISPECIES: caspase family protein [unclassified Streptomyces]|uniref:HD domain-containing protein n=1 Tax=unclassified Streptomyces TaxID=2593676 RepID=UPI0016561BEA|nr:caspase family protein [Streptomyces sp. CB02980]MCB8904678.1 caspase family protein [Streptomyces sp. CB02980]
MSSTTAGAADTTEGPETGRRRALLIGVGRTAFLERDAALSRRFPPLGFVDRDVELVGDALAESGYTVDALHPGHRLPERQDTSVGSVVSAVEEFLLSCEAGDTAFLYVSCHGVTVGEREYLITSDTRPRADGSLIAQTTLEVTPEVLLGPVPDGVTVVVCLDTCRTDQPPSPADSRETPLATSSHLDVAWLRASGRGQPAYADPGKGSHFGIALSEALSRNSPPKTFREVHAFVRDRVKRLTSRLTEPPPTVEFQCVEGLADRLVLCRGSRVTERWAEAIDSSALWRHTSHEAATHERVKERLADLAREVAKSRLGTDSALATPWSDPEYPIRVVDRLGRLVEAARLTGRERLSPAETAALLAAPLLHEGVVAIALSELAALRPDRIDRREDGRGRDAVTPHDHLVCDAARDVSRAHSQVSLAAETLRRRHLPEAATAADHWLRHRFIADWDRLWDRTGDYAAVDHLIDMAVGAVAVGSHGELTVQSLTLINRQLRQVLAHVTVAPGSSPRIDDSGELRWSEHPVVPGNAWRARDLAYLVWLASLLAADPRRMSSVLVDHLGAHRRLVPSDVIAALSEYRLDPPGEHTGAGSGDGYDLAVNFLCPHPALHAAVEELAATADASVRARHKGWKEARTNAPDLLRGIPRKVTTEFLEPLEQQYTKPLERFRLAEDEIRPLLMGTQLYGDKMLAVRELYQNALDACRHRQLRVAYGRRLSKCGAKGREPEITFVQGYDDEDRPYIECRDTGTGMSRRKLTSMFARAGKRYEQDPDFVQERRNWRRAGIEPIPFNSRFGIGVFSYFMLAEEVVVTTSTIDLHGNPSRTEAPLQATIQSGSGLLEIVETTEAPERGGTVVRLYLSADGETPPSLVETLRQLLWVSDHRVTAEELDRDGSRIRSAEWTPGELRASEDWPPEPARAGEDAWLVQGAGRLLLDGVVIRNAPRVDGYVFNLRERDQPVPTVDRNGLIDYDEEGVERRLLAAVPEAVGAFEEVSLRWLWDLTLSEPKLAVKIFDALDEDAVGVLHTTHEEHSLASPALRLRDVGCLPLDRLVMRGNTYNPTHEGGGLYLGMALHRWRLSSLGVERQRDRPFVPDGYPKPVGLDALLFSAGTLNGSWAAALRASALTGESLAVSVRAQRRFAVAGVHVPEVSEVRTLREVFPTLVMADLAHLHDAVSRLGAGPAAPVPAVFAPLLPIALDHGITLAEVLSSVRELTRTVPLPRWEEAPLISVGVISQTEVGTLATAEERYSRQRLQSWQEGVVHPVDLLVRAPSVAQREHLVERIEQLGDLGFSLGPGVSPATLGHRALSGEERRLLSQRIDGEPPWVTAPLTMLDVLARSATMSIPVGRVAARINSLTAATGVSAPPVPDEAADWTASPWIRGLIPGTEENAGPIGPWRVVTAIHRASPAVESAEEDLRHLEACGVLATGCFDLVGANARQIAEDPRLERLLVLVRSNLSRGLLRWDLDADGIGLEPMIHLAARERTTLAAQAERIAALPMPLPLKVADLPEPLRSLPPLARISLLFPPAVSERIAFAAEIPCQRLLRHSLAPGSSLGNTVRTVLAFQPYGGPVLPGPFTGPDADLLEDFAPDEFDLTAFEPGLLGAGTLGPLELVLVAGRFDRTLAETYERYAPFRCLGLDVTVQEPVGEERNVVPDWRDVIVLTARLTGRAPALEGTVDPDHITLCAEETDLSEAQVLDRLHTYSRLFDLALPAPGGPRP